MKEVSDMEQAIELAKKEVEKNHGEKRSWETQRVHDYAWKNGEYDVEIHVAVGSPAKGYVVANYGANYAVAYSGAARKLKMIKVSQ